MKDSYICIGVMTGNSLDAVDVVLTEFNKEAINDICGYSLEIPIKLANDFRHFKQLLSANNGNIIALADKDFYELHNNYINLVAKAINILIKKSGLNKEQIDVIGFHGQTCYHLPPSVAKNNEEPNTLQIGSGQMLADLIGIPVAFDFRSDDIINGGEGAPLAPIHNQHLAQSLQKQNIFPVAFCNGGNTGNIALIYDNKVIGWDSGPFNHLIDYLTRTEKNQPCDFNGQFGKQGTIDYNLLQTLFNNSVRTQNGDNFLNIIPPKSSDPAWYKITPELTDKNIPFVNRVRTAEFFSAYILAYSLKFSPIGTPDYFLVFGGGWNNPVIMQDFQNLIHGKSRVLPEHADIFARITNPKTKIEWTDKYGYNGKFMEARIFADMAKCLLTEEPFSTPESTGCQTPTIGGIMAYPNGNNSQFWSRAAKGWKQQ